MSGRMCDQSTLDKLQEFRIELRCQATAWRIRAAICCLVCQIQHKKGISADTSVLASQEARHSSSSAFLLLAALSRSSSRNQQPGKSKSRSGEFRRKSLHSRERGSCVTRRDCLALSPYFIECAAMPWDQGVRRPMTSQMDALNPAFFFRHCGTDCFAIGRGSGQKRDKIFAFQQRLYVRNTNPVHRNAPRFCFLSHAHTQRHSLSHTLTLWRSISGPARLSPSAFA